MSCPNAVAPKMMGGKRRRKSQRGGNGAAAYALHTVGTLDQQMGNAKHGVLTPLNGVAGHAARYQAAGSRRRRGSKKVRTSKRSGKKGGYWGQVISQAAVPFALLGIQHAYAKRTRSHRHSKSHSSRRHSRR